jgi:hypothetical protein
MAAKSKRVRSKEVGFVGVNLVKGGDMTLYNRLLEEVESDPELDQSKVIRLALKEYFENKDSKK